MTLLVIGLSHRSAPVSVLERAALEPAGRGGLLQEMVSTEPTAEAAVLSTCNRIELYADVDRFHAGVEELSTLLARHSGVCLEELTPYLYVHYQDRAVHHLFTVACGLDSMVVGEGQILGQIKDTLAVAQEQHTAGRLLNDLFQQALRVGKRAHSETGIDRAGQSLVTFGLEQLADGVPVERWAAGRRALVIGAGSMSALAAMTLSRAGVAELVIANRTLERAERLAAGVAERGASGGSRSAVTEPTEPVTGPAAGSSGPRPDGAGGATPARAVAIDKVAMELPLADVVVSCTGSTGLVLTADEVGAALAERDAVGRGTGALPPLEVLDLAMPRDVDAAVHRLDRVRLVDIESLAEAAADAPMAADVDRVRKLVAEEVAAFGAGQRAARITPTVVALRAMAADVVNGEMTRLEGRLPHLDDKERAEITQTVRRVVDKLLHAPTVRVKQLAGEPGGAGYAEALRELFDLDPQAVAAVSSPDAPPRPTGGPDRVDAPDQVNLLDPVRAPKALSTPTGRTQSGGIPAGGPETVSTPSRGPDQERS